MFIYFTLQASNPDFVFECYCMISFLSYNLLKMEIQFFGSDDEIPLYFIDNTSFLDTPYLTHFS